MPEDDKLADKGQGTRVLNQASGQGGPAGVYAVDPAEDIFRQVSQLGGLLLVTFVAPVAPARQNLGNGSSPRRLALAALASKAESREGDAVQLRREDLDRRLSTLESLVSKLSDLMTYSKKEEEEEEGLSKKEDYERT
jgi:hypothetical protein